MAGGPRPPSTSLADEEQQRIDSALARLNELERQIAARLNQPVPAPGGAPNRRVAYNQATSATTVTNNTNEGTGINDGLRGGTSGSTTTTRVVDTPSGPQVVTTTDDPAAEANQAFDTVAGQEAFSSIPALPGGGNTGYFATGDNCERPTDGGFGQSVGPQGGGGAFPGAPANVVPPADLVNDPAWQAQLASLKQEFPNLDEQELYRIIQGESGFNSTAVNANSGAAGFFQFIPDTAAGLGTTTGAIQNMTPAQQLEVYGRYLRQSNYQGGPLGMIQAAPGTYRNLIGQYGSWSAVPRDTEVYAVNSKAWQQNPGWRDPSGRVTIGGIEAYYAKQ
jgi:hypothetical protein